MRVTHIITRLIVGGAQENTVSSVLGLRTRHGLDCDLVTGPTAGPEGSLERLFDDLPGVLSHNKHLVRPVSPWQDWRALVTLTKYLKQRRPDVVHTHSGKAGVLGRLAAKRAGVPVIIHTIHGPSFGKFQGAIANLIFTNAERYAARVTDHFVVVANAMTEQYLAAGIGRPEQYTRVFSGFDLKPYLTSQNDLALRQKLGIAPDDFVIGKIARLFELKGHDDLLAVAPKIVSACPKVKFLLVGDGILRPSLEKQIKRMGLEKKFVFTGLVPPSEVSRYVGIMDALVHLSLREGLPRALPQALAAGKPVVAYDCDGAREVCLPKETGFLIAPKDFGQLENALISLAKDPGLCLTLGARGQALVRDWFPVERMVDDLFHLYQKLQREKTGGGPKG
ncbi:MAG: kanF [Verrucomicrobia bacterium]|jgi:glycosyltransferase involved in cell wall biosynthesis|nr:kanF [Verrucomicrobiota bacterium]